MDLSTYFEHLRPGVYWRVFFEARMAESRPTTSIPKFLAETKFNVKISTF
ncbi:hypothetical protein BVRB_5g123380 [Beta vulgaris subsp. vulgaris]|uniref:Uncharacterized protein n=1 Tax=Beta vulgaris subsp. vulgaris TaxID=3555 RepID=A0A0J8B953_BETVV|nr:hypothetical protein BVRB_5g123380 [Beta vulgaris subsp. vulgaris]